MLTDEPVIRVGTVAGSIGRFFIHEKDPDNVFLFDFLVGRRALIDDEDKTVRLLLQSGVPESHSPNDSRLAGQDGQLRGQIRLRRGRPMALPASISARSAACQAAKSLATMPRRASRSSTGGRSMAPTALR